MPKRNLAAHRVLLVDMHTCLHEQVCSLLGEQFTVDSAYQYTAALDFVRGSVYGNKPYTLAIIAIRDSDVSHGIRCINEIWEMDSDIQIILYLKDSILNWQDLYLQLNTEDFAVLKQPIDDDIALSIIHVQMNKWELKRQFAYQSANMQAMVSERIVNLEKSCLLSKSMLESTHEGIIAIGLDGSILMYNHLFLEMWDIPETLLKKKKAHTVINMMANQMQDSGMFLTSLQEAERHPGLNKVSRWKSKKNQELEMSSHPQFLHGKLVGVIFSFQDVTRKTQLEEQLSRLTTHDQLTGLANHSVLLKHVEQAILTAGMQGLHVGVMFFDVDNFKKINDSLGHNAGDIMLVALAKRLSRIARPGDLIARLGGDEFVVVASAPPGEDSFLEIANLYMNELKKPYQVHSHTITTTTSIGISIYPQHGKNVNDLLKNADSALFAAKREGRNTCQIYRHEFNARSLQRMNLESALHHAIDRNELVLHYQPILDLKSNRILCVEALLRWQHPTLGLLAPHQFMPLAEETGLMIPIGEWVLRNACQHINSWLERGVPPLHVAINISPQQFFKENFVETVENIISETKFNSFLLEFELCDQMLLGEVEPIIQKMIELKNIGIHWVMDDFATGYAGLTYLRQFPFEKVKIDRTFIQKIEEKKEDAAIVEAIIAMAKNMGLAVVAKGVETYGQLHFLRLHASSQIQGYIVHKPIGEKACLRLLLENLTLKS